MEGEDADELASNAEDQRKIIIENFTKSNLAYEKSFDYF